MPGPDLDQFEDDYAAAPAQREQQAGGDYPSIADGKYTARIARAEIKKTTTGKWYLSMGLKITSGEFIDLWLWRKNFLATAQNISFLKQDLELCGLHLTKLSEVKDPMVIQALVGCHLEVTKKTKGGFDNVYLNHRLDDGEALVSTPKGAAGKQAQPPAPDPVWDDNSDIPF